MRDPSGENSGLILLVSSWVNGTGSPLGRSLTYTWPCPLKVSGPRMKVSMRPSGERAGETTESAKSVTGDHSASSAIGSDDFLVESTYTAPAIAATTNSNPA